MQPDDSDLTRPDLPVTPLPGGGVAVDFGAALAALEMLELLSELEISTHEKAPPGEGGA